MKNLKKTSSSSVNNNNNNHQNRSIVELELKVNSLPKNYESLLRNASTTTTTNTSTTDNSNPISHGTTQSSSFQEQQQRKRTTLKSKLPSKETHLETTASSSSLGSTSVEEESIYLRNNKLFLKSPSFEMDFTILLEMFLNGIMDAFNFSPALLSIAASKTLKMLLLKTFLVNLSFCFLTWIWYAKVILPVQSWIFDSLFGRHLIWLQFIFDCLSQALWIYPLYVTCLVMNGSSSSQIVNTTYHVKHKRYLGTVKTYRSLLMSFAQEIYRLLLFTTLFLQIYFIQWIPVIGNFLSFGIFAYYLSFLSFESLWTLQGLSTEQQLSLFQDKYAYFFGFGLPVTLCVYFCPFIFDQYLMNLFVPFLSILTVYANIIPAKNHSIQFHSNWLIPKRLPVFGSAIYFTNKLIQKFDKRRR